MFDPFKFVKEKFGTPVHQLVRRDDPSTSYAAADLVDTIRLERLVLEAINCFPNGCIADQVLEMFPNAPYSSITARFSALLRKGHIEIIGTRPGRTGRQQRIMKAKCPPCNHLCEHGRLCPARIV